jgi:hypothetical protein
LYEFIKLDTDQCAPQEQVRKVMQSVLINSYFADSFIDTDNYMDPNQQNIRKDSLYLNDPDYCAVLYIGHINSRVSRDKGWLFAEKSEISNIKVITYIPDAVPSTLASQGINTLFQVVLYAEHTDVLTYIKYSKIQDVLANLGGVINFCKLSWVVLFTITNYFDISFELYCYTYLHNKSSKIITKKEIYKLNSNNNMTNNNTNRSTLKTQYTISPIRQTTSQAKLEGKASVFRTGCCRYVCSRILGNIRDYNKMTIMHSKIRKELEVSGFLRMKEDVCLMKNIFFSPEEMKIFHHIVDFREVQKVLKEGYEGDVYLDYLRSSYVKTKPDKNMTNSFLIDTIRNLKTRFTTLNNLSNSNKGNVIKENNYFRSSIDKN